jgi:hypothetical protein
MSFSDWYLKTLGFTLTDWLNWFPSGAVQFLQSETHDDTVTLANLNNKLKVMTKGHDSP